MAEESENGAIQDDRAQSFHQAARPVTPVVLALNELLPPPKFHSGRRRAMLELFGHRISWRGIQHWTAGRRRTPAWAWDAIETALAKRNARGEHLRAIAQTEKCKAP